MCWPMCFIFLSTSFYLYRDQVHLNSYRWKCVCHLTLHLVQNAKLVNDLYAIIHTPMVRYYN